MMSVNNAEETAFSSVLDFIIYTSVQLKNKAFQGPFTVILSLLLPRLLAGPAPPFFRHFSADSKGPKTFRFISVHMMKS